MSTAKKPASHDPAWVISEVAQVVSRITGIQLGDRQKTMVQTRLKKRILELGLQDEGDYFEYFQQNTTEETSALVSLLTTHHTYFFREFAHFEALEKKVLPRVIAAAKAKGRKTIRVWSAACSRGQEVYSLSMFLAHHLPRLGPGLSYEIVGTDVDPESVQIARNGVYTRADIKEVPMVYLADHWARGTGDIANFVKAKASIKAPCRFEVGNLIGLGKPAPGEEYDVIFCRNVFIYFTPEQIKAITHDLASRLSPEGFLFIGISESLTGLQLPLAYEGPSIYSRQTKQPAAAKPAVAGATTGAKPEAKVIPIHAVAPAPLRILCVDDSPSVLTILKKVLSKEHGFEVVATAANGLEAARMLKEHPIDAMTLDIHMPEQTGLEYLMANHTASHPPVVMISSVSRESSDLAMQCLKHGASDFVEKPALSNIAERGEEIRTKLLCAVQSRALPQARDFKLDHQFKSKPVILKPEGAFRALVANFSSFDKVAAFCRESQGEQPPTVVFVEGSAGVLPEYAQVLSAKLGVPVEVVGGTGPQLKPKTLYLADFAAAFEPLLAKVAARRTSVVVYGGLSAHGLSRLSHHSPGQLLVEDPGKAPSETQKQLMARASDVVPATSFAYMSTEYLSKSAES